MTTTLKTFKSTGLMLLAAGLAGSAAFAQDAEIRAQLKSFAAEKESQARSLASADGQKLPPKFKAFFSAVEKADWQETTNDYSEMEGRFGNNAPRGSWWQPVMEAEAAEWQFAVGSERYAAAYGNGIIQLIPPGSIYFGGTDEGRFIVTALEKSQMDGDPFFGLTQNMLSRPGYQDYLRSMYGNQIYVPTATDAQKCSDDYYADVQRRMQNHQLEPGEAVTVDPVTGKMQVTGVVADMGVNALLAKMIFDKEPSREFYVEESFPLKWMYPYLEPHGLIFKLNHEPLTALSGGMVEQDQDYWTKTITPMIGDWLNDDTAVADISVFAEKVYLHRDFSGFSGDPAFVENAYAHEIFSKERSAIAGLYAWRAQHDADAADKQRMSSAADFAYRQAWALSPDAPEAIFRYVQFLMSANRVDDAIMVARTGLEVNPQLVQISDLLKNLENYKNQGHAQLSQNQSAMR